MVRKYQRKVGSRAHRTEYSEQQLLAAVTAVKTKNISIYKASKEFNIPYATLHHKCTVKPEKLRKYGGQTQLTVETESLIVEIISALMKWRVPLDSFDLRCLVKSR